MPKSELNLSYFYNIIIYFRIRSDHNIDDSEIILKKWANSIQFQYHNVDLKINNTEDHYEDEKTSFSWSESRFKWIIKLKQEALDMARKVWADYIWVGDTSLTFFHYSSSPI